MPDIGEKAPDFELLNQDEQTVKLSDYRGKKVILFAFPKANTPGCTSQACSFRDAFPDIESSNAVVLGISADTPEDLLSWKVMKNLQYDLLSDADHRVLDAWGAWGKELNLMIVKIPLGATRSYWVIDEQGVVIDKQIGVGPQESVEKALAAVKQLSV